MTVIQKLTKTFVIAFCVLSLPVLQVFCYKCSTFRLPLDQYSLEVDFKEGLDCRVCNLCYNSARQWSNENGVEAKKNKKAAKALAQELENATQTNLRLEELCRKAESEITRYVEKVEKLEVDLEASEVEKGAMKERIGELEHHLSSSALFAQVQKRKIRSDNSTTPWKERLVVASPEGIKYYKAQEPIGSVDTKSLSLVTGAIHSKQSSPIKGQSTSGLQIITKDGTIYEFSMPNGEQDVSLWQKHMDFLMKSDAAQSKESKVGKTLDFSEKKVRMDNPFKMGWLSKQPGKTGFWQKRWFVVSDGLISYYKSKSIVNPVQQLSLVNAEARQINVPGKSKWCFQLFIPNVNRLFVMEAKTSEELVEWITVIRGGASYAKSLNLGEGTLEFAEDDDLYEDDEEDEEETESD